MTAERRDEIGVAPKRKLIEVALPLEAINRESAREKEPFTRNHPRSLHIWWARRPLVTARAVLFAQLVDDPSAHPDRFPTEEAQRAERERLHRIIERLVVWENTRDQSLLAEAHSEILSSTGGRPPPIVDPFAGGGTIPIEAQRLGLEAHASDLNPVAVLINKALIEIPPRFAGRPPVFPGLSDSRLGSWDGTCGLAADVRAYGEWMRDEAQKRIGTRYPGVTLEGGGQGTVVAWIWARTLPCPNPACGIEMPLVRSWWLSKKKDKEAWVRPIIVADHQHPSGKRVEFEVGHNPAGPSIGNADGTAARSGARCVACGSSAALEYVREVSRTDGLGVALIAVAVAGDRRRVYLPPDDAQRRAAEVDRPESAPDARVPPDALGFRVQKYGLRLWADLFTNRQLLLLTTLSDLLLEVRERVLRDALAASAPRGDRLERGGADAEARGDALATMLGLALSRYADMSNSLCSWNQTNENVRALFARQAIPMTWDFAEANPFGQVGILGPIDSVAKALNVGTKPPGVVDQRSAQGSSFTGLLLSTDPPYYDNIGYADLSDFFYVWLRRSLRSIHPDLLSTLLVPKADELVANPYRHDGKEGARTFFEDGFRHVFAQARKSALTDYPITVYYAFKQSDGDNGATTSTGWETLLAGMIQAGWTITATWPMRSERAGRMRDIDSNALASSIVLALRPRPDDAPTTDRRGLIAALHKELPDALRKLQHGTIAPVDLPQAAIGPGMAVFSRHAKVIENSGEPMTVRSALARINEILDEVLNEQEGDFDASTRFAIAWYRQQGYTTGRFGVADDLARARNTAVETMKRDGILTSEAGKVTLLAPAQLSEDYDVLADDRVGAWEVLHHLIASLERGGVPAAGKFLATLEQRADDAVAVELVKELAFLLFSIAEKNGWTRDALAFNTVATAWPDIAQAAREAQASGEQAALDFEES